MADKVERPSFENLIKLDITKLTEMAKAHVSLQRNANKAREKFTGKHVEAGRIMAAFKVVYAKKQLSGDISGGTSFKDYHRNVTGEFPNNHAEACSVAYNAYVITGKIIGESDYFNCGYEWLATAATIYNLVEDLKHASVIEAARILHDRPSDGAKQLRELKRQLKGQVENADGKTEELSAELLLGTIRMALRLNMHTLIMSEMIAEVDDMAKRERSPGTAKAMFQTTRDLSHRWAKSGFKDELLNSWAEELKARDKAERDAAKKAAQELADKEKANATTDAPTQDAPTEETDAPTTDAPAELAAQAA